MRIEAATRKSGVLWLQPEGSDVPHPLWHLWHAGAAYVVGGGREQPVPTCSRALITVPTADGVLHWPAEVEPVAVGSALWDEVVPLLHAKRLNAAEGEDQPGRWARESVVLRLTPTEP